MTCFCCLARNTSVEAGISKGPKMAQNPPLPLERLLATSNFLKNEYSFAWRERPMKQVQSKVAQDASLYSWRDINARRQLKQLVKASCTEEKNPKANVSRLGRHKDVLPPIAVAKTRCRLLPQFSRAPDFLPALRASAFAAKATALMFLARPSKGPASQASFSSLYTCE